MKLAAERPEPIPCYSEMGSVNPVFVLPGALNKRGSAVAAGLQTSFTLGSGQFCTKPGLVLVPQEDGTPGFLKELGEKVTGTPTQTLLTRAIADRYTAAVKSRGEANLAAQGASPASSAAATVQAIALRCGDEGPDGESGIGARDFWADHRGGGLPGPPAIAGGWPSNWKGISPQPCKGDEADLAEYCRPDRRSLP